MSVYNMHALALRGQKRHWRLWNWNYRCFSAAKWVLGTKPGFFTEAVNPESSLQPHLYKKLFLVMSHIAF